MQTPWLHWPSFSPTTGSSRSLERAVPGRRASVRRRGPSKAGWDELEPTFRAVAARLSGGHDVTYEIMAFDVSADMAWTAGFARFTLSTAGGPLTRYTLWVTHVYRRESEEWKVVHEHSNSVMSSTIAPAGTMA